MIEFKAVPNTETYITFRTIRTNFCFGIGVFSYHILYTDLVVAAYMENVYLADDLNYE